MNIRSFKKRVLLVIGIFIVLKIHNPFFAFDIFYKPAEPLGPSSRNTGIIISEIMYNYGWRPDGRVIEYIELYNSNPYTEDISGYMIKGLINYTFPSNTVIGSRQFLVLAKSASDIQAVYGLTGALSYGGTQSISGTGTIQLKDRQQKTLLNVKFSNEPPWPVAADGMGHSLVLARPSYGENDYRAWAISDYRGGSPGRQDTFNTNLISPVVINEICANPATGDRFVEIYNRSGNQVNISDYILTDDPVVMKYKIPRTIYIPPYGRFALPASEAGFSPSAIGETIYLISPSGQRVYDAIKYGPHPHGMSWGRYPDGAEDISLLKTSTPNVTNSAVYHPNLIINEIMYAPISGDSDDEYIELYNRGTNSINLGGWELQGGVNFYFRSNVVIQPGQYLVVAKNMTNLFEKYNRPDKLSCGNMVGDYIGSLNNNGERIALSMPFTVITTDDQTGLQQINSVTVPVDEIIYGAGGDWGKWSRSGGSSLELVNPNSDGKFAVNWKSSDESKKAQWEWDVTSLELQVGKGNADRLQIFLSDKGECLIDDVEVLLKPNEVEMLANSYFENGLSDWQLKGNHSYSILSQDGYQGTKCLHLKSDGAGDMLQNNITTYFVSPLTPNSMISIKARIRWLSGSTNLIIRLGGNYAEFRVGIHTGMIHGTPNEQNTAFMGNSTPGIKEISHTPALPNSSETVLVTAKVFDYDGLSNVSLCYRIDPSTNFSTVAMKDDGTGGDKYVKDGIYSALIPGQPQGTIVAFKIVATDASSNKVSSTYPLIENSYECLVRFGDVDPTNSVFGSYRILMTSDNMNIFTNSHPLSRLKVPITFIYNNRIIYGAFISYLSEIDFQTNNLPIINKYCYSISFPEDDKFLGSSSIEKLRTPSVDSTNDTTVIRNIIANIFARTVGQPYLNVRLVHFYINGIKQGVLAEDNQDITTDYCISLFNTDNIELLFASPWLEYEGNNLTNYGWADFNIRFNKYDLQDIREYEPNWILLSPLVFPDGYNNFLNLILLLNERTYYNYESILGNYIYIDQWARAFAFQNFLGNQNFFTKNRSYNSHLIMVDGQKWSLLSCDHKHSFNTNNYDISKGYELFSYNTNDAGLSNLFSSDYFVRLYKQEMFNLAYNVYQFNQFNTIISSLDSVFKSENIKISSPYLLSEWLSARRSYFSQQLSSLSNISFKVNIPSYLITNTYCINIFGCAPLDMDKIVINSNVYLVKWLTLTNWSLLLPLNQGTNIIYIDAIDRNGFKIPNASVQSIIITPNINTITNFDNVCFFWNKYISSNYPLYNIKSPVVINEIMYNSLVADGDYIELFNPNTNLFVDLSKWIIEGIDYEFPDGSTLGPLEYMVIVKNIGVFKSFYSSNAPIYGQFRGGLNDFGENLKLVIPDEVYTKYIIVDSVVYEPYPPWPDYANGLGSSLQLINPFEDNSRVGNWFAVNYDINGNMLIATPGFANSVFDDHQYIPKIWINEIQVQNNIGITNSFGIRTPWIELLYSDSGNIKLTNYYLSDNYAELLKYPIPDGTDLQSMRPIIIFADGNTNFIPNELHSNFILNTNSGTIYLSRNVNGNIQVVDYIRYNEIPSDYSYGSYPDGQCMERQMFLEPTPGFPNKTTVKIYINEWMASNIATYEDSADNNFEDWIELYNMSYNPVDISGYYLTDNITNKTQFRIQDGTIIPARGFLIIWADKESMQNYPGSIELHANFSLSKSGDSIALFTPDLQPVDIITFGTQIDNVSQGRFPDGSTNIYSMNIPTPALPNVMDAFVSEFEPIRISPGGTAFIQFHVPNVPPNLLIFKPGPGMPADAYLDKDRGIFVWLAPVSQFSFNTNFSIKICDLRPGGSTINVNITIVVVNINVRIGKLNNFVTLTWNSTTQQTYRVEYKDDLNNFEWSNIAPLINATSSTTTILIPITNQYRYFRIIEQ